MTTKLLNAWFSQKQAHSSGYGVFEDETGEKVVATETSFERAPSGKWDDYIYVGKIAKVFKTYDKNGDEVKDELMEMILSDEDIVESKDSVIILASNIKSNEMYNAWISTFNKVNTMFLFPAKKHTGIGKS